MSSGAGLDLPVDGEATVAGVRLPAGRRLAAEGVGQTPVLWATGELEDAAAAWMTLNGRLSGTPLIPVLLSGLEGHPERPWDVGELEPFDPAAVNELDAAVLLEQMWRCSVPEPEEDQAITAELLAPHPRTFPGLAAGTGPRISADDGLPASWRRCLSRSGWAWWRRARPADVLAVVGWTGAINYHATSAPLACVLRSWEDRFGARLVRLGFDTMDLLVECPLPSSEAALAVAAEHFAFSPDNIYQGEGSIRRYAAGLSGGGDLVVLVGLKGRRIIPIMEYARPAAMRQIKPQAVLHRSCTPRHHRYPGS